jgi:hypothetical protein
MRSLYIECAFCVEWISRPLHKWIPSTPRSRSSAHFLPQKAHSIYSKRILSVRTHSISREHILSLENTFYLQRNLPSTENTVITENTFYLHPLAALLRIFPCANTRTKNYCASRELYPPPPQAAKPAPAAAKVVEAKVIEICFRCPEIFFFIHSEFVTPDLVP